MDRRYLRQAAIAAAAALLLTGCASSRAATEHTPAKSASTPTSTQPAAMTPGMVMPDGSTMGAGAGASTSASPSASPVPTGPTAAEKMICAAETHNDIKTVLKLPAAPTSTARWADHRYTCTYTLPQGRFVVSVKQSANPAAAKAYFATLRTTLGPTETLTGLGEASYGTVAGKVVLIKDSDTLMVDATALPAVVGSQGAKRFDFAYEIASDILGCWTGG